MSTKRKMRRRDRAHARYYEIVYGPIEQPWQRRLSKETRDAFPRLHALMLDDPRVAVAELRAWIEREPLPMFFNWLSVAYGALGDTEGVRDTVRENYRRNPAYLFARLNYAELCLRDGDRGRRRIHVSEVAGYFYTVALYHLKAGDRAAAEKIYEMLEEVAPEEGSTEDLRRRLHPRLRDLFSR